MSKQTEKQTALLIDANSLIHRAWHALPPLTAPDGRVVNAAYGFASVLMKILASEHPTFLVVCWDTPEPTYRHLANEGYKAHRVDQPDEFYAQIPIVKEIVSVFGGKNIELPGFEADDLLATFADSLSKQNIHVTLLTSDKDVLQLIAPRVRVMAFKKGVSETMIYDEQILKGVTGLTPEQIPDYKALRGDPSDNLKGVVGIGEKTATELLKAYSNLDGVFKAAHDSKSAIAASVRNKLISGEQDARATLPIVLLQRNAPVKVTTEELTRRAVDDGELRRRFTELGFKTLLARALGEKKPSRSAEGQAKMQTGESVMTPAPHYLKISAKDFSDFSAEIMDEKKLYIQPLQTAQASLFNGTAGLALGSSKRSFLLSAEQIESKQINLQLGAILSDAGVIKVGHGLKKAWHWANKHGFQFDGLGFDTELAAYLLSAGDGDHDLGPLAATRLKVIFPESEESPLFEIDAIRALSGSLESELKDNGLAQVMERFEKPLIPVLAQMEAHGILIEREYFKGLSGDFRKEKSRLEKEMETLAGEPFNPGSPQQLGRILFEVLKVPAKGIKRGKSGFSTAAAELVKLEGAHPIIEKISQYREVAKLLSTYVEALPALADDGGRVHTTYNQALTATGRLSSSNPNLQNIPIRTESGRKIRHGFIAPKGYCLLSCDYSQIDLRVVAALSKDKKMMSAFIQGLDIHTATAAAIWDVPLDEVSKEQRRAAKAINFGIIYGQGPNALSKGAGITFEEAKKFIDEYFTVYSGIREYLDHTKSLAHAQGYVETLFGRRRPIADINSPLPQFRAAAERMAINMPVQGTAADIMKLAMIEVAEKLPDISSDTRLLLQVHDELVFEVPKEEVEAVAKKVVAIMENVEKIGVPIVVDAKYGTNWDAMKGLD